MSAFEERASDFLSQKSIAIVGVSRSKDSAANLIYKTLRGKGHTVYAINPKAETIEGDRCYPDIRSLPSKPDGVFVMTRPEDTLNVVQECVDVGVKRVWMHENGFAGAANTSVSPEAVELCRSNQVEVIAGGCPMMFLEFGHKCMRWMLGLAGKLPA